jgi:hypothetical protein
LTTVPPSTTVTYVPTTTNPAAAEPTTALTFSEKWENEVDTAFPAPTAEDEAEFVAWLAG